MALALFRTIAASTSIFTLQPYLALFTRVAISHASIVFAFVLFSSFTLRLTNI